MRQLSASSIPPINQINYESFTFISSGRHPANYFNTRENSNLPVNPRANALNGNKIYFTHCKHRKKEESGSAALYLQQVLLTDTLPPLLANFAGAGAATIRLALLVGWEKVQPEVE